MYFQIVMKLKIRGYSTARISFQSKNCFSSSVIISEQLKTTKCVRKVVQIPGTVYRLSDLNGVLFSIQNSRQNKYKRTPNNR